MNLKAKVPSFSASTIRAFKVLAWFSPVIIGITSAIFSSAVFHENFWPEWTAWLLLIGGLSTIVAGMCLFIWADRHGRVPNAQWQKPCADRPVSED